MVNLEKLIFVSNNWYNDSRVDYESPFNFVKLLKKSLKLEEFEGSLEWDEVVNI
jgi:hypothetical protein